MLTVVYNIYIYIYIYIYIILHNDHIDGIKNGTNSKCCMKN